MCILHLPTYLLHIFHKFLKPAHTIQLGRQFCYNSGSTLDSNRIRLFSKSQLSTKQSFCYNAGSTLAIEIEFRLFSKSQTHYEKGLNPRQPCVGQRASYTFENILSHRSPTHGDIKVCRSRFCRDLADGEKILFIVKGHQRRSYYSLPNEIRLTMFSEHQ